MIGQFFRDGIARETQVAQVGRDWLAAIHRQSLVMLIGLFFCVNVVNKSICMAPVGALMG